MCRFLVYKGKEKILLSRLILEPAHSILIQSFDSRLRLDTRRPHNGDGFGVGWYTDPKLGPEPCYFTSTIPAWNCDNLARIASKTESPLVFAHVRATTEGNLSEQNCHPFRNGSLMWMQNGGIGAWKDVKRALAVDIGQRWFLGVQGSTDSEWAFALFLDTLDKMGHDPSSGPAQGFGHKVLRKALLKTIERINEFTKAACVSNPTDAVSLLNFAVTDGHSVVCSRYVSSKVDEAASLFFSSGTSWQPPVDACDKGQYKMERRDRGADIVLVASEPLTFERSEYCFPKPICLLLTFADNWVTVPTNSILTIHKQTVLIHPIEDEFYSREPTQRRSSTLASRKGQISITTAFEDVFDDDLVPKVPKQQAQPGLAEKVRTVQSKLTEERKFLNEQMKA